ncbi:MAG: AAA family ATPase [Isosphaeraceae bacterium]
MITRIEIENFKGVGERIRIDLKPITLFFGPNSAGKSTVTHALHYAREILERRNYDADKTISGGSLVDLGGFHKFVHLHNVSRVVKLKFALDLRDVRFPVYFPEIGHLYFDEYILPQISANVQTAAVELSVSYCQYRKRPYVSRYSVEINGEFFAAIQSTYERFYSDDRVEKYRHQNELVELNHTHPISDIAFQNLTQEPLVYPLLRSVFLLPAIPLEKLEDALPAWGKPLRIDTYLPTIEDPRFEQHEQTMRKGLDRWCAVVSQLMVGPGELLSQELSHFRHLGPVRETIPRGYSPPRSPDESRWITGMAAWDLLSSRDRSFIDQVSKWLSSGNLDTGYSLRVQRYKEIPLDSMAYQLLRGPLEFDRVLDDLPLIWDSIKEQETKTRLIMQDENLGLDLSPHDLGVGISHLVPIVVLANDPDTKTAVIEQPELHVHPRLQAELGDLFIHFGVGENKLFIIETHSEHLILRIQRRIREFAEGSLSPTSKLTADDVAIYYFNPRSEIARFERIELDRKGEFIQPWPDDFFEIDFYERFGYAH